MFFFFGKGMYTFVLRALYNQTVNKELINKKMGKVTKRQGLLKCVQSIETDTAAMTQRVSKIATHIIFGPGGGLKRAVWLNKPTTA
jgi:hypothetical protein